MELLSPLYLLAAAAVAIPLWLHLRRRRAERRVVFPAVRYLRQARQAFAQRLHLRHWLLLAARLALVLIAALLAAGFLFGRGDARDHPPSRIALVLDNSASTGLVRGETETFDDLRERALASVALASPEDRFWIVRATRPEAVLGPLAPREAAACLRGLAPAPARADLGAAVRAGAAVAAGGPEPVEVHLFSDLQATSLGGATDTTAVPLILYTPDEPAPANVAVTDVRPAQSPVAAGAEALLVARVDRFAGEGSEAVGAEAGGEEITVRASVNGRVVSLATARPGSDVTLLLPATGGGWIEGAVEIDPSGLRADDRRFFTIPVRPPARVAVRGGSGPFVEASLSALESGGRIRRVAAAGDAEVVWSVRGEGLPEAAQGRRTVVVVPDEDPLALPRLNARLERVGIPWRYAYQESRGLGRLGPGAEWIAGARALVVRIGYRLEPTAPGAGRVWVRLESGEPWLVATETSGSATALLLGSPLSERATELVTAPAMIPFVDALVNGWPAEGAGLAAHADGTEIVTPPRATALELPSGRRLAVEGGSRLWDLQEAGIYRILVGDSVAQPLALNPPAEESDLRPATGAEIERRWPDARVVRGGSDRDWTRAIYRVRRGREAAPWLLGLFLALALVESAAAAAGRRSPEPTAR